MGGILGTLTRPSGSGDLLAGSMGWLRRERDDRCLSLRRSFSFRTIHPGSERSPFSSVSGLFDLAVGTICESPRTGSRTSRSRNDHHRCATTTWLHDRLRLIVVRRCWFRSGSDRNMPTYIQTQIVALVKLSDIFIASAIQTFELLT